MATQRETTTGSTPLIAGDFGANEWLVAEMYERYQSDPASVDAAWHEFFADYGHRQSRNGDGDNDGQAAQTITVAELEPEPAAATAPVTRPAAPAPEPAPAAERSPAPATPAPEPIAPTAVSSEAQSAPLRGAAARVVANMQSSLQVPTATSVRAVPAKLMADNRVVINNHLRRGRGGKISFTHIIGFAIVKALRDVPEMNYSFAVVDGKPTVVIPQHVNLGIAIDLVAKDGSRSLLVAHNKPTETIDIAPIWGA